VCDFCGSAHVFKLHACHNFQCGERGVFKDATGHWASCYACSKLVMSKDWRGLTNRVMREVRKRKGATAAELSMIRKQISAMHHALDQHLIEGVVLTVHTPVLIRSFI
jgi:hypothetical protein